VGVVNLLQKKGEEGYNFQKVMMLSAMNAIPVTDDFDLVKATRLFYTVMCLKRYFPGWGVCMRPVRIPPRGNTARDNSASNQAEENQQRSESSDSEQSNQDGELDDSDTEPLISNP